MNHSIENAYNATVNIKAHRDMINKQAHINNATNSTFTQNDTHNHITTINNIINPITISQAPKDLIITNEYNRNETTFNPNNNQNTNRNDKNIISTNKMEQKCASRDSDVENEDEIDKRSRLEDVVISLLKVAPKQTMLISELGLEITDIFDKSIKRLCGLKSSAFFNEMNQKNIIKIKTEKINKFSITVSFAQLTKTKKKKPKHVQIASQNKFENDGVTSNDSNTNINVNHKKRPKQLIINDDDEIDDVHETPKKKRKVNRNHCKSSNKNKSKHQLNSRQTINNNNIAPALEQDTMDVNNECNDSLMLPDTQEESHTDANSQSTTNSRIQPPDN